MKVERKAFQSPEGKKALLEYYEGVLKRQLYGVPGYIILFIGGRTFLN